MAIIGVTPYLYYEDADAALTWLEEVLGFTDPIRWRDESGTVSEADINAGPGHGQYQRRQVPSTP